MTLVHAPENDAPPLFDIAGKVAVVTGGSRGIGKMIAAGLVRAGGRVYVASRNADACAATAGERSEFGECLAVAVDLSVSEGCQNLADDVAAREQSLDILVNNAGAT